MIQLTYDDSWIYYTLKFEFFSQASLSVDSDLHLAELQTYTKRRLMIPDHQTGVIPVRSPTFPDELVAGRRMSPPCVL